MRKPSRSKYKPYTNSNEFINLEDYLMLVGDSKLKWLIWYLKNFITEDRRNAKKD